MKLLLLYLKLCYGFNHKNRLRIRVATNVAKKFWCTKMHKDDDIKNSVVDKYPKDPGYKWS